MIESAAQVLLSVSNAKNTVDNAAMFRNNKQASGSVFGDVLSQSKSQNEKKIDDATSRRNQSRQAESANTDQRQNTKSTDNDNANKVDQDNSTNRGNEGEKTESNTNAESDAELNGAIEQVATVEQNIEKPIDEEGSLKEASVKQIIVDVVAELSEDTLKADAAELAVDAAVNSVMAKSETSKLLTDATKQVIPDTLNDGEKLKQEFAKLAQTIVSELNASKDKLGELKNSDKLSRLTILSNIEQALVTGDEKGESLTDKLLKPDLAVNVNAAKVLGEQIKLKDFNVIATDAERGLKLDPELLAEGEKLASSLESTTDALLEKMLQRLDLSKTKAEENQFAKIVADKSAISGFSEQISTKTSGDASVASLLSATNSLTGKAGIAPLPQQLALNTNINQPQWGTDFSKRIQFMINNDIKNAELRLDPPELGRINIKISMSQDQASVVFTSAQGNVRETIENALPKLREMLQESGIQLADANVNERQKGNENQAGADSHQGGSASSEIDEDTEQENTPKPVIQHSVDGVIDYFA